MSDADRPRGMRVSAKWLRSQPRRYGFAILAACTGVAAQRGLEYAMRLPHSFLLLLPVILIVVLLAGFWPGITATAVSALAATWLYARSANPSPVIDDSLGIRVSIFVTVAVGLTWLANSLRESEDRYRDLVEHSEDLICTHDLQGNLLSINSAAGRLLGYQTAELLKVPMRDIVAPEFQSQFNAYLERIRTNGSDRGFLCVVAKNGQRRIWEYRNTLRTKGVSRPVVRGLARDVTEQKRAEDGLRRSEQRMRLFIEHAPAGAAILDRDMRYIQVSRRWREDYGLGDRDLVGVSHYEVFPECPEHWKDAHRRCLAGEVLQAECERFERADGRVQWIWWELQPWYEKEQVGGIAIFAEDVTDNQVAAEALRKSEERYRMLFEKTVAGVGIVTLDGTVIDCNDAWARMFGHQSAAEYRGKQIQSYYRDLSQRETLLSELREHGVFLDREVELRRQDGSVLWVLLNSVLIAGSEGEPLIQSTMFDITRRKRAEDALRRSEESYRNFVTQSSEGIFREDLDAPIPVDLPEDELVERILHDSYMAECNEAMVRMYGADSIDEFVGKRLTEFVDPADLRNVEMTREYIRSGFRIVERQSHETDLRGNPKIFCNSMMGVVENGMLVRTWGIQRDVTERVKLEKARHEAVKALRKSEEHFRILVEQASDGIFITDEQGKYVDVNSAGAEMLGYTREEILRLSIPDIVVQEERDRVAEERVQLAGGRSTRNEWRFQRKDGSIFAGEVSARQLPDGRFQGILRDVTERKRGEEILRESERRERTRARELQTILDTLPIPVLISQDVKCSEIAVNRAAAEHLAISEGMHLSPLSAAGPRFFQDGVELTPEQLPLRIAAANNRIVSDFPTKVILADGKEKFEVGNAAPLLDENGVVRGAVAAALDVTKRIHAEHALLQSEERFRVALKDSPITVFNQDKDLRYTWLFNPQLYWQHDVLGKSDDEIIGPKKAGVLNELKRKVLASGVGLREEIAIGQNGTTQVFDVTIEPLFDSENKVGGITAAFMDIARLREMADRLQESRDRLAIERSYLQSEIQTQMGFEEIIGQSPALQDVLKTARVVAPTDSTVLLLGETGTGKELVARSIHALSARCDNTFVKLNCAAVPSGLLESELFGNEKGAFTGAVNQKVGRIELADKGTLFLDEIGELPPELQPKLLRVLQDREFERLGGVKTLHVDVRIIAATNRDLRQDIAHKRFREDLFYRLNVFPIELPPLRERRDDIPRLIQHFVAKYGTRMNKHIVGIPDETMHILHNWNWPGNIRELENMIERMVILTKGNILAAPPAELCEAEYTAEDNLTEMEREHILRVLRETRGVLSGSAGAASRLGLKRTTLQSMIKRLGIQPHEYRSVADGTFGR